MMRFKDCNECLKAGVAAGVMEGCLTEAMDFAPEKVVASEEYREAFLKRLLEGEQGERGLQLPWEFDFRIRRGEMTVWTGVEKSGKSTVLDFVMVCLMAQGERGMVASFEVPVVDTLEKMARQAYGGQVRVMKKVVKRIHEEAAREFRDDATARESAIKERLGNYRQECQRNGEVVFDWLSPSLWVYNHLGIGQWRDLLEDIRWARRRHGITQFVVDNFMRLGVLADDWPGQAEAITAFATAAIELDCHIHMVVHQNKSEARKGGGDAKRAVAGAYQIIANAHNIIEVQRDVRKGELVSELFQKQEVGVISETEFSEQKRKLDMMPDGKLVLHAARNGERQNAGKYLWFLWGSQQYAVHPPGHRLHEPVHFLRAERQPALAGLATAGDLPGQGDLPGRGDLPGQGNVPADEEGNG